MVVGAASEVSAVAVGVGAATSVEAGDGDASPEAAVATGGVAAGVPVESADGSGLDAGSWLFVVTGVAVFASVSDAAFVPFGVAAGAVAAFVVTVGGAEFKFGVELLLPHTPKTLAFFTAKAAQLNSRSAEDG